MLIRSIRRTVSSYIAARAQIARATAAFRPDSIAYLGFAGHGNLGDDAIRASHALALPSWDLADLPIRRITRVLSWASRFSRDGEISLILIGGGTLVGRLDWLRVIQEIYRALPNRPKLAVLGAGVQDPDFVGQRVHATARSIEEWAALLRDAVMVAVRGPRSLKILEDHGVTAHVVGDPALYLGRGGAAKPVNEARHATFGINVAVPEDSWNNAALEGAMTCLYAARQLASDGARIVLLPTTRADAEFSKAMALRLGLSCVIAGNGTNLPKLMEGISGCDVLLGMRLHSLVLGAAKGVPVIGIDYRPKVLDFMASINTPHLAFRPDGVDARTLLDACSGASDFVRLQQRAVQELKTSLSRSWSTLAAHLKGTAAHR